MKVQKSLEKIDIFSSGWVWNHSNSMVFKTCCLKNLLSRKIRWGGKWASAGLFCLFPLPAEKKSCSSTLSTSGCRHSKLLLEAVAPCSPVNSWSVLGEPVCKTCGRNACRAPLSPSWTAFWNLLFSQLWYCDLLCPGVKVTKPLSRRRGWRWRRRKVRVP